MLPDKSHYTTDYLLVYMKRTKQVNIRFRKEIGEKLDRYCEKRGETKSSMIRRLVLTELAKHSFIKDKQIKKALMEGYKDG